MINFSFGIENPFVNTSTEGEQKDYFLYEEPVKFLKHKAVCLQISKWGMPSNIFDINFSLNWRAHDHAGLRFSIEIWDHVLFFNFYDTRHWNWDKNDWETYS